jgi:hypothetical protein
VPGGALLIRRVQTNFSATVEGNFLSFPYGDNLILTGNTGIPENLQYRGEALFQIAHSRGSLMSLWSKLQARQSSSGEP